MNDDIQRCGNELHGIEYWLQHHDPRKFGPVVAQLSDMLQSINQVLMTSYVTNQSLIREVRVEAGKSLVASAGQFVSSTANLAA